MQLTSCRVPLQTGAAFFFAAAATEYPTYFFSDSRQAQTGRYGQRPRKLQFTGTA
jgi:hypothetical protein